MTSSTTGGHMKIEHHSGTKFWLALVAMLGQLGRWR
jgi:hypothetical protein